MQDTHKELREQITPQSLESNDGRFCVKIVDEDLLELTMTGLSIDDEGYMQDGNDYVQKISFDTNEIDRLIAILTRSKEINAMSLETLLKRKNEEKE